MQLNNAERGSVMANTRNDNAYQIVMKILEAVNKYHNLNREDKKHDLTGVEKFAVLFKNFAAEHKYENPQLYYPFYKAKGNESLNFSSLKEDLIKTAAELISQAPTSVLQKPKSSSLGLPLPPSRDKTSGIELDYIFLEDLAKIKDLSAVYMNRKKESVQGSSQARVYQGLAENDTTKAKNIAVSNSESISVTSIKVPGEKTEQKPVPPVISVTLEPSLPEAKPPSSRFNKG